MSLGQAVIDLLWRNALAAIPLALVVALLCRALRFKAATRHAMWLVVLLALLAPPFAPMLSFSGGENVGRSVSDSKDTPAKGTTGSQLQDKIASAASVPAGRDSTTPVSDLPNVIEAAPVSNVLDVDSSQILEESSACVSDAPVVAGVTESVSEPLEDMCAQAPSPCAPSLDVMPAEESSGAEPEPFPALLSGTSVPAEPRADAKVAVNASSPELKSDSRVDQTAAAPVAAQEQASNGSTSGSVSRWTSALAAVRDAVVKIPPLPGSVWLTGSLAVVLFALMQIAFFGRVLKSAAPASSQTRQVVLDVAAELGLRWTPRVMMVEKAISPMIWCGRGMSLLLPAALWRELDDVGRRAVIAHELAHLRRRDHWVCWLTFAIGLLYWWHPLVWWCRRRLREEADFSCDSWVTATQPHSRRAYAEALLAARSNVHEPRCAWPVVGLGATTPRTRRFARRLTMIMMNRSSPGMSRWGAAVVALVAAGAWLSTPLWACPPEETPSAIGVAKARKADPNSRITLIYPTPDAQPTPGPDPATTFEKHMLERAKAAGGPAPGMMGDPGTQQRLDMLEDRLNHLAAMLEALMSERGAPGRPGMNPLSATTPVPPSAPVAPAPPMAQSGLRTTARALMAPRTPAPGGGAFAPAQPMQGAAGGEAIAREYPLPEGKLEALTELMARSDVPVLIERRDGAILVHGTEAQHAAFRAFLELIHPTATEPSARRAYEEALAALGGRSGQKAAVQAQRQAIREHAETYRRQVQQQMNQSREIKRQAEQYRREAEKVRNKANSLSAAEREALERKADALLAQADALEVHADELEADADAMESNVESEVEAMEDALAAAEDAGEVIAEELERVAEEAAEAAEAAAEAAEAEAERAEEEAEAAEEAAAAAAGGGVR